MSPVLTIFVILSATLQSSFATTTPPTTPTPTTPTPTPTTPTNTICVDLPITSPCASVLSYTRVRIDHTTVNASCVGTPYANTTNFVEVTQVSSFPIFWATLSDTCRPHLSALMCQLVYPPCGEAPPCGNRCLNTAATCTPVEIFEYTTLTGGPTPTPETCAALSNNNTKCLAEPAAFSSQPIFPQCQTYTGTFCSGIINYPIYVPAGITQDLMEAQIQPLVKLWGTSPIANGCLNAFAKFTCLTGFPRCDTNVIGPPILPINLPAPFPQFPCRSVCQDMYNKCSDSTLQLIPDTMKPNCTGVGIIAPPATVLCGNPIFPAVDDFPVSSAFLGVLTMPGMPPTNIDLITPCNAYTMNQTQSMAVTVNCPAPFIHEVVTDPRQNPVFLGASCALECNAHFQFTDAEWQSIGEFAVAFTILSFILGVFLFLTWLCIPSKRKQRNTLYFNFCVMMVSLFVLVGFMAEKTPKNVGCKTRATIYLTEDGGYCPLQGGALYYFVFAGIWWWTFIAIDLFIAVIVLPKRTERQAKIINRTYHSVAWGIPFIGVIVLHTEHQWGGGQGATFCWFIFGGDGSWQIWAFFIVPFVTLTSIGFICIISIMTVMARSAVNSKLRRKWRNYVRPILFMIQFGVLFIIVLSDHIVNLRIRYDAILQGSIDFISCLFTPEGTQATCGTDGHPTVRQLPGWIYAGHFSLCAQGLVNFITYGTQWSNFVEWKKFIIAIFSGTAMSYQTSQDGSTHQTKGTHTEQSSNKRDKSRGGVSLHAPESPRGGGEEKPTSGYSSEPASPIPTARVDRLYTRSTIGHTVEMLSMAPTSTSFVDHDLGDIQHAPHLVHHVVSPSTSSTSFAQPAGGSSPRGSELSRKTSFSNSRRVGPPPPPNYPPPSHPSPASAHPPLHPRTSAFTGVSSPSANSV